jgi:hypothetical protein
MVHLSRNAEIGQLHLALGVDQNIRWLDILRGGSLHNKELGHTAQKNSTFFLLMPQNMNADVNLLYESDFRTSNKPPPRVSMETGIIRIQLFD